MYRFRGLSALVVVAVAALPAWPGGLALADAERPSATCPVVQTAPTVDGRLDDAAWKQAAPQRVTRLCDGTAEAEHPVEFRAVVRDRRLYLALAMQHPSPAVLKPMPVVREETTVFSQDVVEIFLAPDADDPAYYHFAFGPTGSAWDTFGMAPPRDHDFGLRHATRIGDDGWTLEVEVPLDRLGMRQTVRPGHRMALNICRQFAGAAIKTNRLYAWSPTGRNFFHVRGAFGELLVGTYSQSAAARLVRVKKLLARARPLATDDNARKRIADAEKQLGRLIASPEMISTAGQWRAFQKAAAQAERLLRQVLAGGDLTLYEVNPWSLPRSTDPPRQQAKDVEEIALTAFQGEYVTCALAAANNGGDPLRIQCRATDLFSVDRRRSAPAAAHVELREAVEVNLRGGGSARDALPALSPSHHMTVPSGRNGVLWLTLDTHGMQPGLWTMGLRLFPLLKPKLARTVRLVVRVLPAMMPQGPRPYACVWAGYVPAEGIDVNSPACVRDQKRHYVNVIMAGLRHPEFGDRDVLIKDADFTKIEAAIRRFGAKGNHFVLAMHYANWPAAYGRGTCTPAQQKRFAHTVWRVRRFFESKGLTTEDFSWYAADEPWTMEHARLVAEFCTRLKAVDPAQRVFVTGPGNHASDEAFEMMLPHVSLWMPILHLPKDKMDRLKSRRGHGVRLFSYQISVKATNPYWTYRMSAWQALRHGFEGIGVWNYSHVNGKSNWDETDGPGVDYALIYEGPGGRPVPSVRWEAWRQGIQDFRYFEWVRQLAAGAGQSDLALRATRFADSEIGAVLTDRDPGRAEQAVRRLRELAAELLAARGDQAVRSAMRQKPDLPPNLTGNGGLLSRHVDTGGWYTFSHPPTSVKERSGVTSGPVYFHGRHATSGPQAQSRRNGNLTNDSLRDNSALMWYYPPAVIDLTFELPRPHRFSHALVYWHPPKRMEASQMLSGWVQNRSIRVR